MNLQVTTMDLTPAWRGHAWVADFLNDFARVAEFWPYPPGLGTGLSAALEARSKAYHGPRAEVVAALRETNQGYGAGAATETRSPRSHHV